MIYRWKHPHWKSHILGFAQGFAEIADGVVTLASLGFFGSSFGMRVAGFRAKQIIKTHRKVR